MRSRPGLRCRSWRNAGSVGLQVGSPPTFHHAEQGDTDLAAEVLDFAEAAGIPLDPWQRDVITDWTLTRAGRWVHRTGCLIVPRQGGKTHAMTARALHALFFGHEKHILVSAHRFSSAAANFAEMVAIIDANPDLQALTKSIRRGHGDEKIITKRGSELSIGSRVSTMTSQTRGRSFDLVVLDEALVLNDLFLSALLPTMSARPNPQVLYVSSSGDHDSEVLHKVRQAGYDRTPGLTFTEWAADPDDDPADRAVWAKVNPSYPLRPTPEAVEQERATLTATAFARERLGIWSTGVPEPALNWDSWTGAQVPSVGFPASGQATLAVDVSIGSDGTRTGALAAAWQVEGRVHTVLIQTAPDTAWLPAKVAEVASRYGIYEVSFCPGGATDVHDGLTSAGITVNRASYPALRSAAARLGEMLGADTVRVQSSDALNHAARTVPRAKSSDGTWGFSSKSVTPAAGLNAIALAAVGAETVAPAEAVIW